jgi:hypothetical protein
MNFRKFKDYYNEKKCKYALGNLWATQFNLLPSGTFSEAMSNILANDVPTETLNFNENKNNMPYDAYNLCDKVVTSSCSESLCEDNASLLKENPSIDKFISKLHQHYQTL